MKRTPLILLLVAVLLFCTCGDRTVQRMLDRAETVMNENPSEAIAVLDSIGDDGLSRSQRMRRLLLLTNAQNKCDTVFRSDSIQRLLVDYYESHGTANERMLAHYLLGRAYYDMGEVPAALESFQNAASCADTISKDCDYRQLSRVYAQMADIFYKQQLYREQMKYGRKAARCAWKDKDTLSALMCYEQEYVAYKKLGLTDSAVYVIENAASLYDKYGYPSDAAISLGTIVLTLIEKGEYSKAYEYMKRYEKESGFFDNEGNIIKGHEYYYKVKGLYCLRNAQLDSAEYFFRKELRNGQDFNNQNAGAEGLAQLYKVLNAPDSVAKYTEYAYAMSDSMYAQMTTETVGRLNAMYDYNRHLKLAEAKSREAQATRSLVWILSLFCLSIILSLYIVILRHKKREEEMVRREENLYKRLVELEDSHKEKERFKRTIEQEQRILNSTIAKHFRDLAQKPANLPSSTDWKSMLDMISRELPSFQALLCDNQLNLRQEEMNICMLIRLRFKPKEICNLTGLSSQNVTNIRKRLLYKIYGDESGGSKDFDQRIMKTQ